VFHGIGQVIRLLSPDIEGFYDLIITVAITCIRKLKKESLDMVLFCCVCVDFSEKLT
jgi:hypothetical protein